MAKNARSKKQTKLSPKRTFSRAFFIMNAKATNAARAKKFWGDVEKSLGKENATIIDITKMTFTKSEAVIAKTLKDCDSSTLLCIGGGDGTVSAVIQTLMLKKELTTENRSVRILPLWGGNANDMAVMLNGIPSAVNIHKILQNAHPVSIYPLSIEVESPESTTKNYIASCYASFGATAEALARMEETAHARGSQGPKHKLIRFAKEFREIGKTLVDVKPIKVEPTGDRTIELYDRLFVNGSRYAKILRSPVDLHDRHYFVLTSRDKNWKIILRAFRSLTTRTGGKISDRQRSFTIKDPTYMQVDGEVFKVPGNTRVKVRINDDCFNSFSTKL